MAGGGGQNGREKRSGRRPSARRRARWASEDRLIRRGGGTLLETTRRPGMGGACVQRGWRQPVNVGGATQSPPTLNAAGRVVTTTNEPRRGGSGRGTGATGVRGSRHGQAWALGGPAGIFGQENQAHSRIAAARLPDALTPYHPLP